MAVDEIIEQLETLSHHELRQVKTAVDRQLERPLLDENVVLNRMEREGVITRPRGGPGYDPRREPPVEIEGESLSETVLRERR